LKQEQEKKRREGKKGKKKKKGLVLGRAHEIYVTGGRESQVHPILRWGLRYEGGEMLLEMGQKLLCLHLPLLASLDGSFFSDCDSRKERLRCRVHFCVFAVLLYGCFVC